MAQRRAHLVDDGETAAMSLRLPVGARQVLPEISRRELWVAGNIGHVRYGVTEHFPPAGFLEEFALGNAHEKGGDRSFQRIHLLLGCDFWVEPLPVDRFQCAQVRAPLAHPRSEEHTSELQSQSNLVCPLLL